MRKKLIFLMFFGILMTGCGGSDSAAPAEAMPDTMTNNEYLYQSTQAPGQGVPESTEEASFKSDAAGDPNGLDTEEPNDHVEMLAVLEASGSNYFTFSRASSITTAEDGTELLYEYSCDTGFASWDPATEAWVNGILDQIQREYAANSENLLQYAEESLTYLEPEYFYSFSNYQEVGAARHDTGIVSLLVLSSVYSGGTHPNSVQTAWNLDLKQHRLLRLEDVIYPESAGTLAGMVKERIDEKFRAVGNSTLFDDYSDTIEASFSGESMTPYWYFNDSGMVIFYNQYELGPHAAGVIKTEISYEELDGILLEDYFPGNQQQIPGNMLLRGDWGGYRKIPITVETDGERLLIGVEGEVYQVQLSEISWLEGTAIGQQMLFSADRMTQNDVLELIGGYDDETRSFAVEFTDGQGNVIIYYIHPEGLSEAP